MAEYQPTSGLGWIHFSDKDKEKVMKIIEMLKPDGTLDELGVGVVRLYLSDAMFKGITTIMTRAKYFFIVPRILHTYLSLKGKTVKIREYLRIQENEIIHELSEKYNDRNKGIIGKKIADYNKFVSSNNRKELVNKPSNIYWGGIRAFHFYKGQSSLSEFLDDVDKNERQDYERGYQKSQGEKGDDRDANEDVGNPFSLPDYDPVWRKKLKINLTEVEADYFKHMIIDTQPTTLLAKVLTNKEWINDFLKANNFNEMSDMPFVKELPETNRNIIYIARDFWKIMKGAHIRFNIILHERHGSKSFMKECQKQWIHWRDTMRSFDWDGFDRQHMWRLIKEHRFVKPDTEHFINNWMDKIKSENINLTELDELVEKQEKKNKRELSKLNKSNDENYSNWIGISAMDFRFRNARRILEDIASGIGIIDAEL